MPRKYKSYRRTARRTRRGRRRYNRRKSNRVTTVVRAPGPIAPRTIVKMKYAETYASDGATLDHLWNLNSTFDPNRTGTGHQPYGRDTYATLYNRYRVFAVKYRVEWASSAYNGKAYIGWDNDTAVRTNFSLWEETPKSMSKNFTAQRPSVFRGHISLPSVTGVTPSVYKSDDRYQAQAGADPAENIILHTGMTGLDGTAIPSGDVYVNVHLTYFVEWFDPLTLGQS